MTHIPSVALATEIGSQIAALTLGTNLFHSSIRAPDSNIPVNSVFVWDSGGVGPLRTMGEPNEIRRALVVVRVRNAKHEDGRDLVIDIMNALRAQAVATYLDIVFASSGPNMLGQSAEGHHYFGLNFLMVYQEP